MYKESYFIIFIATALPLIFGRKHWVRVVCVFALVLCALLHVAHLIFLPRLIHARGIDQLESPQHVPEGFLTAIRIMRDLNAAELPFVIVLIAGFSILSLFNSSPMKR